MEESLLNQLIKADQKNHEQMEKIREGMRATMNMIDEQCSQIISKREIDALHEIDRMKKEKQELEEKNLEQSEQNAKAAVRNLDEKKEKMFDTWTQSIFESVTSLSDE